MKYLKTFESLNYKSEPLDFDYKLEYFGIDVYDVILQDMTKEIQKLCNYLGLTLKVDFNKPEKIDNDYYFIPIHISQDDHIEFYELNYNINIKEYIHEIKPDINVPYTEVVLYTNDGSTILDLLELKGDLEQKFNIDTLDN